MERMQGDGEAVARARAGDSDGFRLLVERHGSALFRLAYRMTGNEHDAEDVVQEAFLKAYRNLEQFEERAQVASWLYRIAANCAYDLLRTRRRREGHIEEDGLAEGEGRDWPSTDPNPERLARSDEVRRRVEAAMKRMSAQERAAFVLRHFEGRSLEEIGRTLDLETNATKQSILRAVRKVRAALGSWTEIAS
jgi:RNA polymerase sigma-70 factor (ECF subfamily)